MNIHELKQAVKEATATVTALQTERDEIRVKREELSKEQSRLWDAERANSNQTFEAQRALYDAEAALQLAKSNALIAEHAGMSKESFVEELRKAVRSKFPIAESLTNALETRAHYEGARVEHLHTWLREDGTRSALSGPQLERVRRVLDRCCPKTPAGNFLPPYRVEFR